MIAPCPFCGSKRGVFSVTNRTQFGKTRYSACIRCPDCHAKGPTVIYHHPLERSLSEKNARDKWNKSKSL